MRTAKRKSINSYTVIMTLLALLSALALGVVLSKGAYAMSLKQNTVIEGNVITLGDVFYDLPRDEDRVLGAAPRPGQDMVLNARTLMRIAVALDLPWRPSSTADYVSLRRAATIINNGDIESRLQDELAAQDHPGKYEIDLPAQTSQIILPANTPATFDITDMNVDMEHGWFEASIAAPSTNNPIQRLQISGKIHRLTPVPILKRALRNGDIIRARDLNIIEMRSARINQGTVLSVDDLVGMTPRRMILDGQPVMVNEVEAPRIVGRGESVTLIFKSGQLLLSAQGKALEAGSKGDIVRVVNASSSRAVEGIVTGEREVSVQTF